jgi:hypothetical protein
LVSGLLRSDERPGQSSQAGQPPSKNPRSAVTSNSFNRDQKTVQAKITRFCSSLLSRSCQVWMALLVYLLLRYLSYLSKWSHSFTRLFTILRAVLWSKLDLLKLLDCYGTAKGSFRNLARPEQAYFPGFL